MGKKTTGIEVLVFVASLSLKLELAKWNERKRLSCNGFLFINPYPTPPCHLPLSEGSNSNTPTH